MEGRVQRRQTALLFGFGSKVSILGFGFRVSGFGFRVSGLGFRVWGFGVRLQGVGARHKDGLPPPSAPTENTHSCGHRVSGTAFSSCGIGSGMRGLGIRTDPTRKVDVRLPGKGNSNSHCARPVHLIITMIKWIRTSSLSINNSLSRTDLAKNRFAVPSESSQDLRMRAGGGFSA